MECNFERCNRKNIELTLPEKLEDLRSWLTEQAKAYDLTWLLAHCQDGVIWGKWDSHNLGLSCDAFPGRKLALRLEMLLHARLFSDRGELLIWRGPRTEWKARLWRDSVGDDQEYIDEAHLLWGDARDGEALVRKDGFVQLHEGSQGIVHAPPIGDATPSETHRARLLVRHYIGEDDAGVARIYGSRLVKLLEPGEK